MGSAADGLLKRMKKVKFIGTIYILHDVFPVLSQLSKRFQWENVNFSHLLPAIKATHAKLNRLKEDKECLKKLQNDLAQNGRLHRCGLTLSDNKMQELCSLMNCYIVALQHSHHNRLDLTKVACAVQELPGYLFRTSYGGGSCMDDAPWQLLAWKRWKCY